MTATTKRKRVDSRKQSLDLTVRQQKQPKLNPFANLPNELVQHVFTFLDTPTLKNVRLGCSSWAYDLVGPFMFETVTLIPHLYFMDLYLYTFRTSRLRIRTMFIDARWVEQMVGLHHKYEGTKGYDSEHRAHASSCYTLAQLFDLYANKTEHLRALESAAIATIQSSMTTLTTLKMNLFRHPHYWDDRERSPSQGPTPHPPALAALLYKLRVEETGDFGEINDWPIFPPRSRYLSIVGALVVAAPQLKQLILQHFDSRTLYPNYRDEGFDHSINNSVHPRRLFIEVLNRVAHADIQLTGDSSGIERPLADTKCRMLRSASKLTSLKLHVRANSSCQINMIYETFGVKHIPLLKSFCDRTVPSASLPSLRTLWLRDLACTSQELQHFLVVETPRLQSLTLDNCMLIRPEEQKDSRACWIKTLKQLRTDMRLTMIDFRGYVTNMGRQHWHIAEDSFRNDLSSVKARMIDWFLNKNALEKSCPLNVFEIGEEELEEKQEGDILCNATDESWSMTCPAAMSAIFPYHEAGHDSDPEAAIDTNFAAVSL